MGVHRDQALPYSQEFARADSICCKPDPTLYTRSSQITKLSKNRLLSCHTSCMKLVLISY